MSIRIKEKLKAITNSSTSSNNSPTNKKGKLITCLRCGKSKYKMLSKIKKHNFCSPSCYREYLRSPVSTLSKGWKHTIDAKKKIQQASLARDYDAILTDEARMKMAYSAKNKVWTDEAREKLRKANLGKKLSVEQIQKIKAHGLYGTDNYMWKEFPSYAAMHMWVISHKGRAKVCVDCGITNRYKKIEWSNIDHKYRRNLDDYIARCTRCHRRYDKLLPK